jgi:hypothetical protein
VDRLSGRRELAIWQAVNASNVGEWNKKGPKPQRSEPFYVHFAIWLIDAHTRAGVTCHGGNQTNS